MRSCELRQRLLGKGGSDGLTIPPSAYQHSTGALCRYAVTICKLILCDFLDIAFVKHYALVVQSVGISAIVTQLFIDEITPS
jgi:hypothetical protein